MCIVTHTKAWSQDPVHICVAGRNSLGCLFCALTYVNAVQTGKMTDDFPLHLM